MDICIELVR